MSLYALHRLDPDTLDAIVEAASLDRAQMRADHPSNPGSRDCLALTGTAQDLVAFTLSVEALLRDQEEAQPLVDALTSVRTHPAGQDPNDGVVYFWPTITVTGQGAHCNGWSNEDTYQVGVVVINDEGLRSMVIECRDPDALGALLRPVLMELPTDPTGTIAHLRTQVTPAEYDTNVDFTEIWTDVHLL